MVNVIHCPHCGVELGLNANNDNFFNGEKRITLMCPKPKCKSVFSTDGTDEGTKFVRLRQRHCDPMRALALHY
ncbi:hypothetical protein BEH94_10345 [Candidatus Altiarchaeales archaeon WOR_SM1_SCG]|nr:hypothetical protein BEH94_10345 [Candidatus Altiarchaeales archaeon WOR_SM1_SCG]